MSYTMMDIGSDSDVKSITVVKGAKFIDND
jgi:hypothetical protein